MRDENCKLTAAAPHHSVSLRQSPAVPFAFPMLRCTAPKEWTPHCTATTSPPWPLCCLLYCSVLACLRHDYPCGREEKINAGVLYLLRTVLFWQNYIFNCPRSQATDLFLSVREYSSDVTLFPIFFQDLCGFRVWVLWQSRLLYLWQTLRWQYLDICWILKAGIVC